MKKIESLLLTLVLLLSSVFINAQTSFIGFKAGLSLPELRGGTNEVSKGYTSGLLLLQDLR